MKSFLHGKQILGGGALRSAGGASLLQLAGAGCAAPAAARAAGTSPQVEVVKEGDKVVRLVVTCACGERVEIECLYPAGA